MVSNGVMTITQPNLQQISLHDLLRLRHKYTSDGDDPDATSKKIEEVHVLSVCWVQIEMMGSITIREEYTMMWEEAIYNSLHISLLRSTLKEHANHTIHFKTV